MLKLRRDKEFPMSETTFSVHVPNNLLDLGLSQEDIQRRISEWLVFSLFSEGKISSGKAGKLLDITRIEFIQLLQTRGIAFINYTEDDIKEELEAVEKLDIKSEK
jgi:predicted HTH domain antitoxin